MKNRKTYGAILATTLLCLCLASCTGQVKKDGHGKAPEKIEVPDTYQGSPVIQAYLHLKDALVLSDSQEASIQAKNLVASLEKMDGNGVESIRENAMKIKTSDDLGVQRQFFKPLSDSLAHYASEHDMGVTLYKQHCPMAFDNTGGDWLSTTEEINNPYFGSKMLHCGVVKEEL